MFPRQCATECPSASFHENVVSAREVFPCLTTPAPSAEGRNPPNKRRRAESAETLRRWAATSRQYPPHQYREQALVKIQGHWRTRTPPRASGSKAYQRKSPPRRNPRSPRGPGARCLETRGMCPRLDSSCSCCWLVAT